MDKLRRYWNRPEHCAYLFIAPALFLLVVFRIIPTAISFACSLFDIDMFLNGKGFIGLANFREMFAADYFWNALKVTIKFTLIEVPVQMLVGLVLAAMLTSNTPFNKSMRAVYFAPIVCSATVVAIMWKMFLHSNIGIATYWLERIGIKGINFLNSPAYTFYVLVFMSVWRSFGMSTVILLSAMQNVPSDIYEAARIDGCSPARSFVSITLPLIKDTFGFVFLTRLIGSLQVFDLVFTTTSGGPARTTETLVYYTYVKAFSNNRMGYGAAVSMALFAIILVLTVICYGSLFKEEKQ